MNVFFLDTNIFLQCRPLKDLAWHEVCDDPAMLLLIPNAVREEIDKNKYKGNNQIAKRSRNTSSFFRSIIQSKDCKIILRDSGPHVEISFALDTENKEKPPDILDLTNIDNQIIWEALTYKIVNPDMDVSLLTHDTNPMITAKRCGLQFAEIPEDWLLPPEPDSRDKKIIELEKKIQTYEENHPNIIICVKDLDDTSGFHFVMKIKKYKALSSEQINKFLIKSYELYPMCEDFNKDPHIPIDYHTYLMDAALGYEYEYKPPNENKIKEYKEIDYPQWQKQLREFFQELPKSLELPYRRKTLSFIIKNKGNAPGLNSVVEFKIEGGFLFETPIDDQDKKKSLEEIRFPPAPRPKTSEFY